MATKYQLTQKEYDDYQQQLTEVNHEIDENVKAIKEAKEQGDLSENADYSSAKEKETILAQKKENILNILKNCEVIVVEDSDFVSIGKKVTIRYNGGNGDVEEEFLISSSIASDILINKLSTDSPIGKAIVGRKKGETVHVQTPVGMLAVKIINVANEEK